MNKEFDDWWESRIDRIADLFEQQDKALFERRDGQLQINQSEVAARTGLTQSSIGRIFVGKSKPNVKSLAKLAGAIGWTPQDFFAFVFEGKVELTSADTESSALFALAEQVLSRHQVDWIVDKISTMMDAKQQAAENPEFYEIAYGENQYDQRRQSGRKLAQKDLTRPKKTNQSG